MKIGSWFLKIALGVISLLVIVMAAMPFPQLSFAILVSPVAGTFFQALTFVAGLYLLIVAFLVAAFFAERLLLVIDRQQAFSDQAVHLLATIKWCVCVMAVGALMWLPLIYSVTQQEDAPGIMVIALGIIAIPVIIAVFLAVLQRLWASALDYKRENDLTI
ncbi:DUF2975 domain-containing protein [Lacticaseibacillus sharpeae]|uniref:DUF2975 domain-containing protein n=1 Tax=Lacticaseibacillus sharpeae TaxID=1626 RepID=UPI0006D1C9A8|nr:DUF2975 domain-containing protein [Lacticaseibacillus sharpeae]